MMNAVTISMLWQLNGYPLGTPTTVIGHRVHLGPTKNIVHGSSSLNETPFKKQAANHRSACVAALLSEFCTSVGDLELYLTQLGALLSEYAIRIDI